MSERARSFGGAADAYARAAGALVSNLEVEVPLVDERFESGELCEVPHAQRLDAELLVTLVSTTSHAIVQPPERRAAMLADVDRFARGRFGDAEFELPYLIRAWRLALR